MYNYELCNILELHKLDIMFMNCIIFMNITQLMNIIHFHDRIDKGNNKSVKAPVTLVHYGKYCTHTGALTSI